MRQLNPVDAASDTHEQQGNVCVQACGCGEAGACQNLEHGAILGCADLCVVRIAMVVGCVVFDRADV